MQHILGPAFCIRRLGEMALQLGLFQMAGKLGWHRPPNGSTLAAPKKFVVNQALLQYLSDNLSLVENITVNSGEVSKYHDMTQQTMPDGSKKHEDEAFILASKELQNNRDWPLLTLAEDHSFAAATTMGDVFGLSEPFVTLHIRTCEYMGEAWNNHNLHRNADILTYLPAIDHIIGAGYQVVQIGGPKQPTLPERPGLIDYAHSDIRSDWLDVYLMGAARFMMATSSGPMVVAHLFGVPIVLTNAWPAFALPFGLDDLFLPKTYKWRYGEPLREGDINMPELRTYNGHEFDQTGVLVVDNTGHELLAIAEQATVKWPYKPGDRNGESWRYHSGASKGALTG